MLADTIEIERQRSSFAASAVRLARRASHRIARHLPLPPTLMHNSEPLVSFTFDDVPVSAYVHGAPLIEAHDARATFYIATGWLGQRSEYWTVTDPDHVADLHERGHEIGLHSHLHRPTSMIAPAEIASDLQCNREALWNIHPGIEGRNFAYPFGQCTLSAKRGLASLVRSSRSIYAGVNRGFIDLHYIRSVELCDARLTPERLKKYIEQTHRTRGWLVFCLHDVSDAPSPHGCSRRFLEDALEHLARRHMRIVTVDAALDLIAGAPRRLPSIGKELAREFLNA